MPAVRVYCAITRTVFRTGVEGPWDVSSGDKRSPRLNVTITALEEDNETSPGGKTLK